MTLYLGNQKVKLHLDGSAKRISLSPRVNGTRIRLSDGSILKDANGAYLILKKEAEQ